MQRLNNLLPTNVPRNIATACFSGISTASKASYAAAAGGCRADYRGLQGEAPNPAPVGPRATGAWRKSQVPGSGGAEQREKAHDSTRHHHASARQGETRESRCVPFTRTAGKGVPEASSVHGGKASGLRGGDGIPSAVPVHGYSDGARFSGGGAGEEGVVTSPARRNPSHAPLPPVGLNGPMD